MSGSIGSQTDNIIAVISAQVDSWTGLFVAFKPQINFGWTLVRFGLLPRFSLCDGHHFLILNISCSCSCSFCSSSSCCCCCCTLFHNLICLSGIKGQCCSLNIGEFPTGWKQYQRLEVLQWLVLENLNCSFCLKIWYFRLKLNIWQEN